MGIPYRAAIDLIFSRWMTGTPRSPIRKMIPRSGLRTAGTFFRRPAGRRWPSGPSPMEVSDPPTLIKAAGLSPAEGLIEQRQPFPYIGGQSGTPSLLEQGDSIATDRPEARLDTRSVQTSPGARDPSQGGGDRAIGEKPCFRKDPFHVQPGHIRLIGPIHGCTHGTDDDGVEIQRLRRRQDGDVQGGKRAGETDSHRIPRPDARPVEHVYDDGGKSRVGRRSLGGQRSQGRGDIGVFDADQARIIRVETPIDWESPSCVSPLLMASADRCISSIAAFFSPLRGSG